MTDQPNPTKSAKSEEVAPFALIAFKAVFAAQCAKGRDKYRMPLMTHNGRDMLEDAMQGTVDLAQYITGARMERDDLLARLAALEASLSAANQRAEDAELVAWGLVNGQHGYGAGARRDSDGDPLPCIYGRWKFNAPCNVWTWEFLWHDKKHKYQRVEFLGSGLDSITLTPDARAALKEAKETHGVR